MARDIYGRYYEDRQQGQWGQQRVQAPNYGASRPAMAQRMPMRQPMPQMPAQQAQRPPQDPRIWGNRQGAGNAYGYGGGMGGQGGGQPGGDPRQHPVFGEGGRSHPRWSGRPGQSTFQPPTRGGAGQVGNVPATAAPISAPMQDPTNPPFNPNNPVPNVGADGLLDFIPTTSPPPETWSNVVVQRYHDGGRVRPGMRRYPNRVNRYWR